MSITEETGKVITSTVETFRAQPALLFLTLVNIAFLIFTYMLGNLVLDAYSEQQRQIHSRYEQALITIDRCIATALHETVPWGSKPAEPPYYLPKVERGGATPP
jgi:hypothetical protein